MTTATAVRERPMLFSAPMIVALLAGKKTQTRRIIKPQPNEDGLADDSEPQEYGYAWRGTDGSICQCPHGRRGSLLWVRETWATRPISDHLKPSDLTEDLANILFRADEKQPTTFAPKWRPSIFMPRWASRITLEITEVRAQRLQDISEEDAIAEGVKTLPNSYWYPTWARTFCHLWNDINPDNGCEKNPHVWAITFKRISP